MGKLRHRGVWDSHRFLALQPSGCSPLAVRTKFGSGWLSWDTCLADSRSHLSLLWHVLSRSHHENKSVGSPARGLGCPPSAEGDAEEMLQR